jgi:hypothetical protein
MKKAGEHIRVNFGQSPFIFDIDGMMSASNHFINSHSLSHLSPRTGSASAGNLALDGASDATISSSLPLAARAQTGPVTVNSSANTANMGLHPQATGVGTFRASLFANLWTNFRVQQEKKHIRQEIEGTRQAHPLPVSKFIN